MLRRILRAVLRRFDPEHRALAARRRAAAQALREARRRHHGQRAAWGALHETTNDLLRLEVARERGTA